MAEKRWRAMLAVIRKARPSFRNNHDKVAFAVHAYFVTRGFVLNATGRPAFADNALSSSSKDEVGADGWNEFDGNYAFVYMKPMNCSKKVLVKCLSMDEQLLLDAIADGEEESAHLEIAVGDYINPYSEMFKHLGKLVIDLDSKVFNKLYGGSRRHIRDPRTRIPYPFGPWIPRPASIW